MTPQHTYSWIFVSIAMRSTRRAIGLREIIGAADYIDHAIPTRKELEMALGWLLDRDLILKHEEKYTLTNAGRKLHAKAATRSTYVQKMIAGIAEEFKILEPEAEPEQIAAENFQSALDSYYQNS